MEYYRYILYKVVRAVLPVAAFLLVSAIVSCSGDDGGRDIRKSIEDDGQLDSALTVLRSSPDDYSLNEAVLKYCTEKGKFDTVIRYFPSIFRRAASSEDERLMLNAGLFLSQAYLFKDRLDSCWFYLDRVSGLVPEDSTGFSAAMMHNIEAIYAVKAYNGYADALGHFREAYEISAGDTLNMGIMLLNMTTIYLELGDTSGRRCAEQAYEMAQKIAHPYLLYYSTVILSDMLLLSGEYGKSLEYARDALEYSMDEGRESLLSTIYMIMGANWARLGDSSKADEYFSLAGRYLYCAESGQHFRYCLMYGSYLAAKGDYMDAIGMFTSGLALDECSSSDSLSIYEKLSDTYLHCGNGTLALEAYKKYHYLSDSLALNKEERRFNDLQMKYEMARYEAMAGASELKAAKADRRAVAALLTAVIVIMFFFGLFLLSRRKAQMYRLLVHQHQEYIRRERKIMEPSKPAPEDDSSSNNELWGRIRELMEEEKAYRRKDISVDWLANALGSNRSYISKTINVFSGMTFFNYINYLRINDAIRTLSEEGDDTPLKSLADSLGYNSLSTFYKAFCKETGCPPSKYRQQLRKMKEEDGKNPFIDS